MDIRVTAVENDLSTPVIDDVDWINCDATTFLSRLRSPRIPGLTEEKDNTGDGEIELIAEISKNLRVIKNEAGEPIGRACIAWENLLKGSCITVGGLKAGGDLRGVVGVFEGQSKNIVRSEASIPLSAELIASWATEQSDLVSALKQKPEYKIRCARIIHACGGDIKDLPVVYFREQFYSLPELSHVTDLPDELLVLDIMSSPFGYYEGFNPVPNLMITFLEATEIIGVTYAFEALRPATGKGYENRFLAQVIGSGAAAAWNTAAEEIEIIPIPAFMDYPSYKVVGTDSFDREVRKQAALIRKRKT